MVRPDGEMGERNGMYGMGGIDRAWRAWRCWQRPHGPNDGGWAGTARVFSSYLLRTGILTTHWLHGLFALLRFQLQLAKTTSTCHVKSSCRLLQAPVLRALDTGVYVFVYHTTYFLLRVLSMDGAGADSH